MRWEFGTDMADQFSPFVAIDSETDDLPIGAVRDLWEVKALERKDLEISRCEQLYRTQAFEACRVLFERLRSWATETEPLTFSLRSLGGGDRPSHESAEATNLPASTDADGERFLKRRKFTQLLTQFHIAKDTSITLSIKYEYIERT